MSEKLVVSPEGLEAAERALRNVAGEELEAVLEHARDQTISARELYSVLDGWLTKFFEVAPLAVLNAANIVVVDEVVKVSADCIGGVMGKGSKWCKVVGGDTLYIKRKED